MAFVSESTSGLARERWDADSGSPQTRLSLTLNSAPLTDTDQPAAAQFLNATSARKRSADLTGLRQVRLQAFVVTGGAAGALLSVRYIVTDTGAAVVGSYLTLGSSSVQVSLATSGSLVTSGWIDLVAGAKTDVVLCPVTSGGDGAADPVIGQIGIQFR